VTVLRIPATVNDLPTVRQLTAQADQRANEEDDDPVKECICEQEVPDVEDSVDHETARCPWR
jgi:hypothetical protein